jgi:hypothetical protein
MSRPYYGRHHLPQKRTKRITPSTQINRDFYQNLRRRGRTHTQVMKMIQPERHNRFLEDILPVVPETIYGKKKSKSSGLLERIKDFFN